MASVKNWSNILRDQTDRQTNTTHAQTRKRAFTQKTISDTELTSPYGTSGDSVTTQGKLRLSMFALERGNGVECDCVEEEREMKETKTGAPCVINPVSCFTVIKCVLLVVEGTSDGGSG